jgi:hypothetical protein
MAVTPSPSCVNIVAITCATTVRFQPFTCQTLEIGANFLVITVVERGVVKLATSTHVLSTGLPASFSTDWNLLLSVLKPVDKHELEQWLRNLG